MMSSESTHPRTEKGLFRVLLTARSFLVIIALAIGSLIVFAGYRSWQSVRYNKAMQSARVALMSNDVPNATEAVRLARSIRPDSIDTLLLGMEIAATDASADNKIVEVWSEQLIGRIHELTTKQRTRAGALEFQLGRASRAEKWLRMALGQGPESIEAQLQLMNLLRLQGRHYELLPLIKEQIQLGQCPTEYLFIIGWPHRIWLDTSDRDRLAHLRLRAPHEALLWLVDERGDDAKIETRLTELAKATTTEHQMVEPIAVLGKRYCDQARWDAFLRWNHQLRKVDLDHPEVWNSRGIYYQAHSQPNAAIRCYGEVLTRSPFHYNATYALSRLLSDPKHDELKSQLVGRAEQLSTLHQLLVYGKGQGGFPDALTLHDVVKILDRLGRRPEAQAWSGVALQRYGPKAAWARKYMTPAQSLNNTGQAEEEAARFQNALSSVLMYEIPQQSPSTTTPRQQSDEIRFRDVAMSTGINFLYDNGSSAESERRAMYEISAGGVGVVDLDNDSWPDIYLTQGGKGAPNRVDHKLGDRLFLNVDGMSFRDVTTRCQIQDDGFGQGVAAGDIDNDGWVDLLVVNIGISRLFRNLGDGTFADWTPRLGEQSQIWRMSAGIADVNGDSIPDAFFANYLGGNVFSRVCRRDDRPVQCRPTMFPAEPNIYLQGSGNGSWMDETKECRLNVDHGKSMGVVIGGIGDSPLNEVFISNDMMPNVLFRHDNAGDSKSRFVECGHAAGVALGEGGEIQAGMGIAVADVNRDGYQDLLVTNFLGQPNNLYIHEQNGIYSDRARGFGLFGPSLNQMGWGAQFIDGDLDGFPDLVVSNGHLEDYSAFGEPSTMATQVFRNQRGTGFVELPSEKLGPYFQHRYFGRTVTRLDWNQDGRPDVIVGHVSHPLALLENRTETLHQYLGIELVGTTSSRDAIGARVMLKYKQERQYHALCAGDGFQCSQQHRLLIGVGDAAVVDDLEIAWPSGLVQHFTDIPVGVSIRIVESASQWHIIHRN